MLERTALPFVVLYTLIFGSLFAQSVKEPQPPTVEEIAVETTTTTTTTVEPAPTTTTLSPPLVEEKSSRRVPSDLTMRCPMWEEKFAQYGLKPVKVFSYIAWRESRCRPKAVNATWDDAGNITWTLNKDGSIDRGLMQINSTWKTVTATVCGSEFGDMDVLYDVDCNLRVARHLLDNGGLGHWGM